MNQPPTAPRTSEPRGPFLVGQGTHQYEPRAEWGPLPIGYAWPEVAGVAVDSSDRVFVFNRGPDPVIVFDRHGEFQYAWGRGIFRRPHGITIGPDDSVYCTDDSDHTVRKFTPRGELLLTIGTSGCPSDTGATSVDFRTIRRAGPPFHFPTNVALAPGGEIYVADGYGNARVHQFTAQGTWIRSWGTPGPGQGEFRVPHGIAVDAFGRVIVADRENSRLQFFTPEGEYLEEWHGMARPCQLAVDSAGLLFVAELGYRAGMWPGTQAPEPDATGGRVSVYEPAGQLVSRWGGGADPTAPGDFFAPHDLCLDAQGDLYVAEVVYSAGGNRGLVPADCHSLQKFVRH